METLRKLKILRDRQMEIDRYRDRRKELERYKYSDIGTDRVTIEMQKCGDKAKWRQANIMKERQIDKEESKAGRRLQLKADKCSNRGAEIDASLLSLA